MTALTNRQLPAGYTLFARYAFPPNELGYCGPADADLLCGDNPIEVALHAREFDGAWPYLRAIADAIGDVDPLHVDVVRSYWVGAPLLDRVDPAALLDRLRAAFQGQVTGALTALRGPTGVLAHHSFHVFLVYPWIRFLDRDPGTSLQILQSCRIRWGTVDSVDEEHVVILSRPLILADGMLVLADPAAERVRWSKAGASLIDAPVPGDTVSAHWDWVCDTLSDDESTALANATHTTLGLVNAARTKRRDQ